MIENKVKYVLEQIALVSEQISNDCTQEAQEDGSVLLYGPFPSFLIMIPNFGVPRYLVHVNADAPNLVYLFKGLNFDMVFDGAFAVDGETGELLLGPAAYAKKEDNILKFAEEILGRRLQNRQKKEQEIYVPEKKIIIK